MRKLKAWGLAAALAVGLTATAGLAADEESGTEDSNAAPRTSSFRWSPAFVKLFRLDEKKPAPKKPAAKPKKEQGKNAAVSKKPAAVVDEAVAERAREEAVLVRRLQVCDKLTEIALRTNDTELLHRAEALDERARTTYAQRTAYMRGSYGGLESAEKTMDRNLRPASTRSPDTAGYTVPGNDRASREAIQEVNP